MNKTTSRLVYSTDKGSMTARKKKPVSTPIASTPIDGTVRIRRETKGRKGKGVTTLQGFDLDSTELKNLAKQLKQLCSTGGTVKNDIIEIQGDHREKLKAALEQRGHRVVLAGG